MRGIGAFAFVCALTSVAHAGEPFDGLHSFLGVELTGGPAAVVLPTFAKIPGVQSLSEQSQNPPVWGGSGLVAIRFGVLFGRNEIALEVSPFTSLPFAGQRSAMNPNQTLFAVPFGPVFQGGASYARYFSLWRGRTISIDLPARLGAGGFGGNDTLGVPYFTATASVGLSMRIDRVLFDLRVPVFRYAASTQWATIHWFAWQMGLSGSYVF